MMKKNLYIFLAILFIVASMAILLVTAKALSNDQFFYGIFTGMAMIVTGWIFVGLAFMEKKKAKKAQETQEEE
jgi:hypothetical protein